MITVAPGRRDHVAIAAVAPRPSVRQIAAAVFGHREECGTSVLAKRPEPLVEPGELTQEAAHTPYRMLVIEAM